MKLKPIVFYVNWCNLPYGRQVRVKTEINLVYFFFEKRIKA